MEKFIRHTGIGAPLRRSAVDTDQIIPAVYLKRVTRTGFEDALFASWRANESDFILNQEAYKRASVLVAGPDFGTGSSREHAVWALKDYGFKVVLAPRFADIFRGNAGKQGLVAGVISQEDAEQLWKILETEPGTEVSVDLEQRTVAAGGFRTTFQIDDYVRWTLMEGLDDISLTLQHEDEIAAYEAARPSFKPRTLPARHLPEAQVVPARAADMPQACAAVGAPSPPAGPPGPHDDGGTAPSGRRHRRRRSRKNCALSDAVAHLTSRAACVPLSWGDRARPHPHAPRAPLEVTEVDDGRRTAAGPRWPPTARRDHGARRKEPRTQGHGGGAAGAYPFGAAQRAPHP